MKSLSITLLMGLFGLFSFKTAVKPLRVIFFGDSITEAAVHPGGYIVKMQEMLAGQNKPDAFDLIGAGIGGNKVYDLYLRLEEDVLDKKPDVVFLFVGVNDVWHKKTSGTGTDADKFQKFYAALIRKIQAGGSRVIVCTPACIGEKTDCTNSLDGELNQYSDIIRDLSKQFQAGICDLRQEFANYEATHNPTNLAQGVLTTDGVHLNELGNKLVAELMLTELGK
ncbi:MAG: GDSL-type esterase/lipase family protein [Saprospiraceae bacterium]